MSCRCKDIDKMEREYRMLMEVRSKAEEIMVKNYHIGSALSDTAAAIPGTLIIPDDKMGITMMELNEDSTKALTSMMNHIDVAFEKLMKKLEKAYAEDDKFHHRKKVRYVQMYSTGIAVGGVVTGGVSGISAISLDKTM